MCENGQEPSKQRENKCQGPETGKVNTVQEVEGAGSCKPGEGVSAEGIWKLLKNIKRETSISCFPFSKGHSTCDVENRWLGCKRDW